MQKKKQRMTGPTGRQTDQPTGRQRDAYTRLKLKTIVTEFSRLMRSGGLLAYLSLNRLMNGIILCSRCYFSQIQHRNPISQKFNLWVMDQPTDGWTDTPSYKNARTHLNKPARSQAPTLTFTTFFLRFLLVSGGFAELQKNRHTDGQNALENNGTMSDDEVVASDVPRRTWTCWT